jgi:Zn-dependent protease
MTLDIACLLIWDSGGDFASGGIRPSPFGAYVFDFTLNQLVLRLIAIVFIAGVHGVAVAGAAAVLGDPGPRYDRRLAANSLAHLDLLGSLSGVLFSVGWIKPITIDPALLRGNRLGLVLVVIAGTGATLAAAVVLHLVRPLLLPLLGDSAAQSAFALIEVIAELSMWFALVNVLPLPCLTGGHLLVALMPQWRQQLHKSQIYMGILLIAVAATGRVTATLEAPYRALSRIILGE